jgi:hypothetical protein
MCVRNTGCTTREGRATPRCPVSAVGSQRSIVYICRPLPPLPTHPPSPPSPPPHPHPPPPTRPTRTTRAIFEILSAQPRCHGTSPRGAHTRAPDFALGRAQLRRFPRSTAKRARKPHECTLGCVLGWYILKREYSHYSRPQTQPTSTCEGELKC